MNSRETFLQADDNDDSKEENVEAMINEHEDFDKAISDQQEKFSSLQTYAHQFIQSKQYAGPDIIQKKKDVSKKWEKLKEAWIEKRARLAESQTLLQLSRDTDEIGKDLASVQNLTKKHQLVEADIIAHQDRTKDMNEQTDSLIDSYQFDSADIQNNQNNNSRDIEDRKKQNEDQIKHI